MGNADLTVGEAALRMGVSAATARRMAADGRISARKSGKQWIVDARTLRRVPSGRRRRTTVQAVDVVRALRHVQKTDLSELILPDVLRHQDSLANEAAVLAEASARAAGGALGTFVDAEVDKTAFFARWIVLLDIEDRVAYQAVVAALAPRIEQQTPDCVFSARLSDDPRYFVKRGSTQWLAWRAHVRGQVEDGYEWVVKTDLSSYFDTIPHHQLLAEVAALNPDPNVAAALAGMLREWAIVPGQGLPQGPNASRVLGNLYLTPVDRAMLTAGWRYSRFLDDVRIATKTKAEANLATRQFQNECRSLGLIVSAGKTEILHAEDALTDLTPDKSFAAADYLMRFAGGRLARPRLKSILKGALKSDVTIGVRAAKFSLWRLARLRDPGTLRQVLTRLEDLAPVASVVAAYLTPFVQRRSVVKGLEAFFADPDRSRSTYLTTWLLAAMLEHDGPMPEAWVEIASRRVKDKNQPAYLRSIAAVVMARGARAADIAWLKKDISLEHDPAALRGYAVGLHWVRQLDNATQRRLVSREPRLADTVDYLKGRATLPSLVYPNGRLAIQS